MPGLLRLSQRSQRSLKIILAGGVVLVGVIIWQVLGVLSGRTTPHRLSPFEMSDIGLQFNDATILDRYAGQLRWMAKAQRVEFHHEPGGIGPEAFRRLDFSDINGGALYDKKGVAARFQANYAQYDALSQQLKAGGGIEVVTPSGDRFEAPAVTWFYSPDRLLCDGPAQVWIHGDRLTAPSVLFLPSKHILSCPDGARLILHGRPVKATKLIWNLVERRLECPGLIFGRLENGDFQVAHASWNLKTGQISAQSGEVRFIQRTEAGTNFR